MNSLLEARSVTRRFGSFVALDSVDFSVRPGEIHALLGENGAGKSTLMNLLSGLLRPTDGQIFLGETPVRFSSPSDAAAAGIGMVHQHFLLVPNLSVAENLLLGADKTKGGALSWPLKSVLDEAKRLAESLGWTIPFASLAGDLPVGTQQRIEILKALRGETRVLIFDEPTAVLTPTETPELFAVIRKLAESGRGIVFISHKLDEVLALASRVTVLRRGKVVATFEGELRADTLADAMVGAGSDAARMLQRQTTAASSQEANAKDFGALRVSVESVTVAGARGSTKPWLDSVSFGIRAGEILGFAGVDGNGQAELAECLSGLRAPTAGRVAIDGKLLPADPRAFRHAGVGVVPADRQRRGLALSMTLTENIALGVFDSSEFRRGPILLWPKLRARAAEMIRRFDIRAQGPGALAGSLSGGNQQKVVLARALGGMPERENQPAVVVAANPTRGLDVGAIAYVHEALRRAQADGAAIALISTELDEVVALSDRIAVLFDGKIVGIVAPDVSRETLGRMMGGQSSPEAAT